MPSDVARLRFVLSADSGGLKSGCKEAIGSLKDMSSQAGQAMNRLDSGSIDWRGLKKSARSLKFVGREMGGMVKGGLGDLIGIAGAGAAMGPVGAAMAAGAVGVNWIQQQQQEKEREREASLARMNAASQIEGHGRGANRGMDVGQYRQLAMIAGEDTKFLDDMARSMKDLADAGPAASSELKKLGRDIQALGSSMGLSGQAGKEASMKEKTAALEKEMEGRGQRKNFFGGDQAKVMEDFFTQKYQKEGLQEGEAKKKAREKMSGFTTYSIFGGEYQLTGGGFGDSKEQTDKYQAAMSEVKDSLDEQKKSIVERAALRDQGGKEAQGLRTNKEKLSDRMSEIKKIEDVGGYGGTDAENKDYADRARKKAEKELGSKPAGMAGAVASGSQEAYSLVAQAQMAAQGAGSGGQDVTDATVAAKLDILTEVIRGRKSGLSLASDVI